LFGCHGFLKINAAMIMAKARIRAPVTPIPLRLNIPPDRLLTLALDPEMGVEANDRLGMDVGSMVIS
jgi:hypothetical protein